METDESQAAPAATATSQPNKASTLRLVIRARIIPELPPQATAPQRWNGRALALVVGLAAVLMLTWVSINVFTSNPTSVPAVNEGPGQVKFRSSGSMPASNETTPVLSDVPAAAIVPSTDESEAANTTLVEPRSTKPTSVASEVQEQADASPSTINEVIPDVPQSALQTIRGTIRVSVRVIVDKEGTVVAATTQDRGPSRYFERLALAAAKKWTFTPAVTQEQQTMLVRFNFTREGTTARAYPSQ